MVSVKPDAPEKLTPLFYQRRGLRQFSGNVSDQGNN